MLAALAYYDARNDRFAASAELGQMAMQAGIANNIELALLPLVGAIETRGDGRPAAFTLDKARRAATALGVKPSVHAGGASWIAVSSIGAQEDVAVPAPLLTGAHLPAGHPYRTLKDSSHGDTAVRMQELALRDTKIIAPISGVIARRYAKVGQLITEFSSKSLKLQGDH